MAYSVENPWIRERETIMDAWKPDYNRGEINNMWVNPAADFFSMSRDRMRQYARMLKSFGYTGMQMTDSCTHWRWFNDYGPDHDRKKDFCDALHAEGMKASLWVWAANFNGHGWNDPAVCYKPAQGDDAYADEKVFACFNKYYDIYAELAPYFDRLVMHFFDPGHLDRFEDIIRFASLLERKFREKNPDIEICVDTWSCPDDFPQRLVAAGKKDWMFLELPFLPSWGKNGRREKFRKSVRDLGGKLGVWSWYTADIEVDQNARFVVNPKVIKYIYTRVREQGDHIMVPSYWSEMDSYHVLNLFSLYCAGQMLIDPERDPEELLSEIAYRIYGDRYGEKMLFVLRFVEDMRSGDCWDTHWWPGAFTPGVQVDFSEMLPRAQKAMAYIAEIAADADIRTEQPLPVSPTELARLVMPHVEQLTRFTEFRVAFDALERKAEAGASPEELTEEVKKIWQPIPDYNAIIGVWGQPECRVQAKTVFDFCRKYGLEFPKKNLWFYTLKKRYYEYLVSDCKAYGVSEARHHYYEGGYPFSFIEDEVLAALAEDGLIEILNDERKSIRLVDADAYKYR